MKIMRHAEGLTGCANLVSTTQGKAAFTSPMACHAGRLARLANRALTCIKARQASRLRNARLLAPHTRLGHAGLSKHQLSHAMGHAGLSGLQLGHAISP